MKAYVPARSIYAAALVLAIRPNPVQGNAIASWWVDTDDNYAPQIFQYNATANTIYASLCNSLNTPIFARNESAALETTITPLKGTSIASVGYLSDDGTLESNVFYLAALDDNDAGTTTTIASAPYTCNTTSGHWTPSASATYVSNGTNCGLDAAPAIDATGGLAALYLDEEDSMRVFFKTAAQQTHYLQYLPSGDCTGWSYAGIASNLTTGLELAVSFLPSTPTVWTIAQTVFANESADEDVAGGGEIEISTSNADGVADLWSINRMPTQIIAELKADKSTQGTLSNMSTTADSEWEFEATDSWGFTFTSFSGAASRIGLAADTDGIPSVFYIGTDGYLRRFSAAADGKWQKDSTKDDSKWPAADIANDYADFGLAYDTSGDRIWMFYEVDGQMTQVYQSEASVWQDFTTLATYNASLAATSSGDTSGSESSSGGSSESGSNSSSSSSGSATTIGLGIGLGIGIPLVCAVIALLYFNRRRQRSAPAYPLIENGRQLSPGTPRVGSVSPAGLVQNQGYWQDGVWVDKTVHEYYADGNGPGARHIRQPLGELDVVGHGHPVYEMGTVGNAKYELPNAGERRVELQ